MLLETKLKYSNFEFESYGYGMIFIEALFEKYWEFGIALIDSQVKDLPARQII